MKLPKKIQAGPFEYEVISDSGEIRNAEWEDGQRLAGQTRHTVGKVLIDMERSPSDQRDTMLHESIHCVLYQIGFHNTEWTMDEEERFVRRFSPALLDLLRRNPKLVAFLTGE